MDHQVQILNLLNWSKSVPEGHYVRRVYPASLMIDIRHIHKQTPWLLRVNPLDFPDKLLPALGALLHLLHLLKHAG